MVFHDSVSAEEGLNIDLEERSSSLPACYMYISECPLGIRTTASRSGARISRKYATSDSARYRRFQGLQRKSKLI